MEAFDEQGRPTLVKVGPYDYTVTWHQAFGPKHDLRGQHDENNLEIMVDADAKPMHQAVTFLHEVCHALFYLTRRRAEELDLEQQADLYSTGLTAFWRDNPGVFTWWSSLIYGIQTNHN